MLLLLLITLIEIQGPLRRKMWPVRLVLRWCTFMPSRHHELTACGQQVGEIQHSESESTGRKERKSDISRMC